MQTGTNQGRKIRSFYKVRYQTAPPPPPPPPPPHITHIMVRRNGRAGDTSPHCKIRRQALKICVAFVGCVSFFNWEDPRLVS